MPILDPKNDLLPTFDKSTEVHSEVAIYDIVKSVLKGSTGDVEFSDVDGKINIAGTKKVPMGVSVSNAVVNGQTIPNAVRTVANNLTATLSASTFITSTMSSSTFTVGEGEYGWYILSGSSSSSDTEDADRHITFVSVNGVVQERDYDTSGSAGYSYHHASSVTMSRYLNVGDIVRLEVQINSPFSTVEIESAYLSVALLG